MQTPDEIIAVVTAFKNGAEIEARAAEEVGWLCCPAPAWNFYSFAYRIKPKPRVVYVQFTASGAMYRTRFDKPASNLHQWTKFTEDLT